MHVDAWSLMAEPHAYRHPPEGETGPDRRVRQNQAGIHAGDGWRQLKPGVSPRSGKGGCHCPRSRYGPAPAAMDRESIRPYQRPGQRITASVDGGREPVWARNGEVFYRSLTGEKMFAVSVKTAPALTVGAPLPLFQGRYFVAPSGSPRAQYDVTADGRRFLMIAETPTAGATPHQSRVVVVQHWFDDVASKFKAGNP